MTPERKQAWLHRSEVIDSLRIVPRLFLGACFAWTVQVNYTLLSWYIALPREERSIEATGFGVVLVTGIFAFLKLVFETYSKNGRDWNQQPSQTITTVQQTTTGTPP